MATLPPMPQRSRMVDEKDQITTPWVIWFNDVWRRIGSFSGMASEKIPLMDGTPQLGNEGKFSDGLHRHPTDTTRAADNEVVHNFGNETVGGIKTFEDDAFFLGDMDITGDVTADNLSGSNTGDETLAVNSGLTLTAHVLAMGTPSTITGTSTNSVTTITHNHAISLAHDGTTGLQGGATGEHYHLTSAQCTVATQAATGSVSGYLSSSDWSTFNGKQNALSLTSGYIPVATGASTLGNGPSYSAGVLTLTSLNLGNTNLSNYTEGTWSPALIGTTGSAGTYATSYAYGSYVRIGSMVLVKFWITLTNRGSWTGTTEISGLPFTSSSTSLSSSTLSVASVSYVTLSANYTQLSGIIGTGSTVIILRQIGSGNVVANLDYPTAIANNTTIVGMAIYTV